MPRPGRRHAALRLAVVVAALLPAIASATPAEAPARRVVAMNPSLVSILIALDAADRLVGVDEYSARLHPQVAALPRVGGLFNPSLEAVVALEPDLVAIVPSAQQRDFRGRLDALGIEVLELPNLDTEEILASIEVLGARVGRAEAARTRVAAIRAAFDATARASAARPPVRALVVLQRDPLYVVGGGSFIDEMLRAAGAENVAGGFADPYPRVDVEWVITTAPDVILDTSDDPEDPARFWRRWPSIPAVARGRTLRLPGERLSYPGPHLDRALALVARTLHGAGAAPAPPSAP